MFRCECGFEAKTVQGLAAHRRGRHVSSNAAALLVTLEELKVGGRLERIDAARVQSLRSMAESLDLDASNAALWRQYREALKELTADDSDDSVDEAIKAMFA